MGARPQRPRPRRAPGGDAAAHRRAWCGPWRERVERVRLLYLYPSALDDALIDAMVATGVPYFDLSLQHVSRPLVQRMRRWGDGERFLERIARIRAAAPDAALRSSFILGYPGETEDDHDPLLVVPGRGPARLGGLLHLLRGAGHLRRRPRRGGAAPSSPWSGCASAAELQDAITAERRAALVGERVEVLVDEPGVARSHREAPEIDGIVHVDDVARRWASSTRWPVDRADGRARTLWAERVSRAAARAHRGSRTFGPSALNTPANAITVARLLATPVLVVMVAVHGPGWAPFARGPRHRRSPTGSTDGWPAARARPARGPSSTPWPTRPPWWASLCALAAKGELVVAPRGAHRGARGVDERLPHRRGPARHLHPGPARRAKVKTLVQGIAILLCLAPVGGAAPPAC